MLQNKRSVAWCVIVMRKPLPLPLVALIPPNCIGHPLRNLRIEMTSNTLFRRNYLMVHQTVDNKDSGNFLNAPYYDENFFLAVRMDIDFYVWS
jgi:hypothetical protein